MNYWQLSMKHTNIPCERSNRQTGNLPDGCLQCVTVASRLLQVEELTEVLAFDFDAGPIPKLREECRLKDPVEAVTVLSTCLTLRSLVNVGDSQVVPFAHLVKNFERQPAFPKNCNTMSSRYHSFMGLAHTAITQACLATLLHLDELPPETP